jgi:hypothetical protein
VIRDEQFMGYGRIRDTIPSLNTHFDLDNRSIFFVPLSDRDTWKRTQGR